MKPVEPREREGATPVVFAKDQPEYIPLPSNVTPDGLVMTEWEPTALELAHLAAGARVRLWIWTHGNPLQPVALDVAD